ncbi:MAG: helix-turn-helix domain-containing protein [Xanthomonadales bacterium]|nr:helix-turn-helix domain-containing protein [Xanthomonadales bacterium]
MDIPAYLKDQGMTQQEFANLIGVTQGRVSHWLGGKRVPAERCLEIEVATKGAVTRADLRPDVFGPPVASSQDEQEQPQARAA